MTDASSRPLRVFLCHSSGDKPTVRELYQKLSAEGWVDVWLDEEKLLPGQDFDYEIEKALDESDAVIVTLSTGSVTKEGYVQKELRFVLDIALEKPEGTIFILPVRLDDCQRPRRLRPIQGIDYFPLERRELAYARLRRSLELRANHLNLSTHSLVQTPDQHQASPLPFKPYVSEPVTTDPSVDSKPTPSNPHMSGSTKTNLNLLWKFGRMMVIFLVILGFSEPWIRKVIPGPSFMDYGWYEAHVEFIGALNWTVLMPLMVGALFLLTLVRLIPSRLSDSNAILLLERLSAGIAPLTMFIPIVAVEIFWPGIYLLRGFWLLMAGIYLASINILFESRFTMQKGQKGPRWAWVLAILITLSWLALILLRWIL